MHAIVPTLAINCKIGKHFLQILLITALILIKNVSYAYYDTQHILYNLIAAITHYSSFCY